MWAKLCHLVCRCLNRRYQVVAAGKRTCENNEFNACEMHAFVDVFVTQRQRHPPFHVTLPPLLCNTSLLLLTHPQVLQPLVTAGGTDVQDSVRHLALTLAGAIGAEVRGGCRLSVSRHAPKAPIPSITVLELLQCFFMSS